MLPNVEPARDDAAAVRSALCEDRDPDARYRSGFYPMGLGLLCVAQNFMPIAWWSPMSRSPFRFVLAIERRNYTCELLQRCGEAALCFLPWRERRWVVEAGFCSGRRHDKAEKFGVKMRPSHHLQTTVVPVAARAVFEMQVHEWSTDGDHALFRGEVVHAEEVRAQRTDAILFLGGQRFASLGEGWRRKR